MEQNKPGSMRNLMVELKVNFELFLLLLGFAAFTQIAQLHAVINSVSPESAGKRASSRRNALHFQKKTLSAPLHIGDPAKGWLEWGLPFPAKISQTGGVNTSGFVPLTVLKVLPKTKWSDHLGNTGRIFSFPGSSLFLAESWSLGRRAKKFTERETWIRQRWRDASKPHWLPLIVLLLEGRQEWRDTCQVHAAEFRLPFTLSPPTTFFFFVKFAFWCCALGIFPGYPPGNDFYFPSWSKESMEQWFG